VSIEPLFRLEFMAVIVEKQADGHVQTEATDQDLVGQGALCAYGRGNGPVNALRPRLWARRDRGGFIRTYATSD